MPSQAVAWILPAALLTLTACFGWPARPSSSGLAPLLRAAVGIGLIAATPSLTAFTQEAPRPAQGHFRLTALDIGQGDALLVETAVETVLVDTGGSPLSDFDPGSAIIAPALRARGTRVLDAVVVTHFHADHMGGLRGLLAEMPTRQVWVPGSRNDDPATQRFAAALGTTPVILAVMSLRSS